MVTYQVEPPVDADPHGIINQKAVQRLGWVLQCWQTIKRILNNTQIVEGGSH